MPGGDRQSRAEPVLVGELDDQEQHADTRAPAARAAAARSAASAVRGRQPTTRIAAATADAARTSTPSRNAGPRAPQTIMAKTSSPRCGIGSGAGRRVAAAQRAAEDHRQHADGDQHTGRGRRPHQRGEAEHGVIFGQDAGAPADWSGWTPAGTATPCWPARPRCTRTGPGPGRAGWASASTTGVSSTAVVSSDSTAVATTATSTTSSQSRTTDPRASRAAARATVANTPDLVGQLGHDGDADQETEDRPDSTGQLTQVHPRNRRRVSQNLERSLRSASG